MKLSDVELVIFDMDGLIYDTETIYLEDGQKILYDLGYPTSQEFMLQTIGLTSVSTKKIYMDTYGTSFPFDELYTRIENSIIEKAKKGEIAFMEGAKEIIQFLSENNKKIALASSSERPKIELLLKNSDVFHYFDYIISGDEVTHGKPHPEIFLTAAEKIGAQNENVVVLEDSLNGIRAAYDANMKPFMIPDKIAPNEEILGKLYKKFDSLLDVIDYFNK